jgi:HAE1 family hydrophobic/amphiphilic exporter-1
VLELWFKNGLVSADTGAFIKLPFPYFNRKPVIYEIMEKLIHKLTKGKTKQIYEALMVADYEHKTIQID